MHSCYIHPDQNGTPIYIFAFQGCCYETKLCEIDKENKIEMMYLSTNGGATWKCLEQLFAVSIHTLQDPYARKGVARV